MKQNAAAPKLLSSTNIQVLSDFDDTQYSKLVQKNQSEIEKIWLAEVAAAGANLFNGSILNLVKIEQGSQKNSLILHCHPIEYKHFLVQRQGVALGLTPLAVSGIVFFEKNGEKVFFIGKRPKSVTQYPGWFEFIPSGSVDSNIDFKSQILTELKEELGIGADLVKKSTPFCLIYDDTDQVYDIGFEIEVTSSNTDDSVLEYTEIYKIPLNALAESLEKNKYLMTSKRLFEAWTEFRQEGKK